MELEAVRHLLRRLHGHDWVLLPSVDHRDYSGSAIIPPVYESPYS